MLCTHRDSLDALYYGETEMAEVEAVEKATEAPVAENGEPAASGVTEWIEELRADELELLHRLDRILSPFDEPNGEHSDPSGTGNPLAELTFDLISVKNRVLVFKAVCE